MSETILIWAAVIVVSGVVFGVYLRGFQRRLAADRERRTTARQAGLDRAPAQYPHIDELRCIGCGSCVDACPEGDVLGIVAGRAVLINGMRCVGHGRCEEVCPVGAIHVGLGDTSDRPDLPLLDENQETSVPGIFIAGELSGFSLIRNAIAQGAQVGERIAVARPRAASPSQVDLIVVGAGPAGIATALLARERGLSCIVLDEQGVGGTVLQYPRRKLVLTQPVRLPLYGLLRSDEYTKEELLEIWQAIPERFDLDVRTGVRVDDVRPVEDGFVIVTRSLAVGGRGSAGGPGDGGGLAAASVVLALGRRGTPRRLGVPGEDSAKVLYQLLDAVSYSGRKVLVVGGGDSAVEAAMALARQPRTIVSLSYRRESLARIKKRNQDRVQPLLADGSIRPLFGTEVVRIDPDRAVLRGTGGEIVVENDDVFVLIGGEPPYDLLRRIGIRFCAEPLPERRPA